MEEETMSKDPAARGIVPKGKHKIKQDHQITDIEIESMSLSLERVSW